MQRLRFAGWEATIGVVVLGAFWGFGALGLLGLAILLISGQVAFGSDVALGLAILAGGVIALAMVLARDRRLFRIIDIADDGSWTLRNHLGRAIARIPPGAERAIVERRREAWMYIGTARRYTQSWFELTCDGRTFESSHGTPRRQAKARDALDRLIKR